MAPSTVLSPILGSRRATLLALTLVAASATFGCADRGEGRTSAAGFAVEPLLGQAGLASAHVGAMVVDLRSGHEVAELNGDKLFIPASTMKLALSYAALKELGAGYRFTTSLWALGMPAGGGAVRQLVLLGDGDPFLADGEWEVETPEAWVSLAEGLAERGIDRVAGPLIVDGSLFGGDFVPFFWSWGDLELHYAAPISSVNAGHNVLLLDVRPARTVGGPARIRLFPELSGYPSVSNEVVTAAGRDQRLSVERHRDGPEIHVSGTIGIEGGSVRRKVAITNPPEYSGRWLSHYLRRAGIAVGDNVKVTLEGVDLAEHEKVGEVRSESLQAILARMNRESDNLAAETVLRSLALAVGGPGQGDWTAGLRRTLRKSGFPADPAARLVDGSGLSRTNLLAPVHLVWVLAEALGDSEVDLRAVLPDSSGSRSLKNHPMNGEHGGRVVAKTGSFETTHCLAGYYLDEEGTPGFAFALMVNGLSGDYQPALRFETLVLDEIASIASRSPR